MSLLFLATHLRFEFFIALSECLRSVTEHSNEKWTLMDVAHNDTRGSSQRLKEKMENIRKAKFGD